MVSVWDNQLLSNLHFWTGSFMQLPTTHDPPTQARLGACVSTTVRFYIYSYVVFLGDEESVYRSKICNHDWVPFKVDVSSLYLSIWFQLPFQWRVHKIHKTVWAMSPRQIWQNRLFFLSRRSLQPHPLQNVSVFSCFWFVFEGKPMAVQNIPLRVASKQNKKASEDLIP